ncbi:MAG: hypothetical protein QOI63_2013 [Thermoplasmata archaeon]|jgi:hypothetical protein|nr:hypothetical protein [Thermoplasmata archaeon]
MQTKVIALFLLIAVLAAPAASATPIQGPGDPGDPCPIIDFSLPPPWIDWHCIPLAAPPAP